MAGSAVIGALRVNLSIDTAAFANGLKGAETRLQKFGATAKKGLAVAGAAATAAAGALSLAVKGAIDSADEMSKAAQKYGISTEELSRLKYAADLSGVSFERLGTSVGRLSRNMKDASEGIGEGAEAFEQLGIGVTNADGSLRPTSDILAELADRFSAMPDGAEKTALAMELMGRSGADMIPLLNGGSAAMRDLMAEADTFGQVFSKEMGLQAEAFNDNMSRLAGTFGNLAARVAGEALPHLEKFSQWLVENGPQIQAFASIAIEQFARFASDLIRIVEEIRTFATNVNAAWDSVTMKVNQFTAAVVGMKDQAIAAVSAMVEGITSWVTGRLNAVWDSVTSRVEAVRASFARLYDSVVGHSYIPDMVTGVEDWMGRLGSSFGNSIKGLVDGTLTWRDALSSLLSELGNIALSGLGGGGGILGGLLKNVLPGFKDGGSFTIGGAGGVDSKIVAFRATPGEHVTVDPNGGAGGVVRLIIEDGPNFGAKVRAEATGVIVEYDRRKSREQMRAA